jgi:hypothetical protein
MDGEIASCEEAVGRAVGVAVSEAVRGGLEWRV